MADEQGKALYESACAVCHRSNGKGAYNNRFPSLTHNASVGSSDPSNLVMTILYGVDRKGEYAPVFMPGFAASLNNQQIAQIASYLTHSFGNPHVSVSEEFVAIQRQGGKPPLIIRLIAWLPEVSALFIALLIAVLLVWRKKKHRQR